MRLIDEWHQAWKYLSVQANVLGGAMASAYATFYQQLKETISPTTMGVSDRGCVCASTSGLARDSGFCGSIVIYEYA